MKVRAKIEELELIEIYQDYVTLKELAEKYYYASKTQLQEAPSALLDVLRNQMTKRGLEQLEREHNDNLVEEVSVEQIKTEEKKQEKLFSIPMNSKDDGDDIEDFETDDKKKKKNINNGFIVYTTDRGKTFLVSSPYEWKWDMGVPVGYVISAETKKQDDYKYSTVTICATNAFRNMTLFGGKIDNIDKEYHFTSTLYEAGNDYNGLENTMYLYASLNKTDNNRCALTTVANYKIKGVDEDAIVWYIPSCGEIKECFSSVTTYWLEKEVGVEKFYPILTSSMSSKDAMWVYGLTTKHPSLTNNVNWEYTLLPFANVKIENMYE